MESDESGGKGVAVDGVESANEESSTENVHVEKLSGNDGGLGSKEVENNTERFPGEGTCKSKEEEQEEVKNEQEMEKEEVNNSIPVVQKYQGTFESEPENAQQDTQSAVENAVVASFGQPIESALGSETSHQEKKFETIANVSQIMLKDGVKSTGEIQTVDKEMVDELQYGAEGWTKDKDKMEMVIESEKESENNMGIVLGFGRHPKMDRIQEALYMSLVHRYERVKEELRYAEEVKQCAENRRGEVGIELYGLQQQITRLKALIEETNNPFSRLESKRKNSEVTEERKKEAFIRLKNQHDLLVKELSSSQVNVDTLQETLRQVEAYNTSMRNKIEVTKREANKTEEVVQGLEKRKGRQDAHIELLSNRIQSRREEITGLQGEVRSYQSQMEGSDRTIRETVAEIEAINFEKKQLIIQWKSSLLGLTRRDEALTSAMKSLTEAEGAARDYEAEVDSIKRDISKAQNKNESLTEMRDKIESELKVLDDELQKMAFAQKRVAEEYSILERSLEHTESEEKVARSKESALIQKIDRLQSMLQEAVQERQKLEAESALSISNEETVSQAVRKIRKKTNEMVKELHIQEIEATRQENELARIQVDVMDTESQHLRLTSTKNDLDSEISQKEDVIKQYQQEIQQKEVEIEKKTSSVQGLNRKYEKLMEQQEDPEHLGPWEATIRKLQKEILSGRMETDQMKQSWMRDQARLVNLSAKIEGLTEQLTEQKARTAILQRKKQRLLHDISVNQAEARRLKDNVSRMHIDSGRLHSLVNQNGNQAEELVKTNTLMKKEFVLELRELEHTSMELEVKIKHARETKITIMEEILEEERQAMLFDKKIKLNKALNKALDPEMGQGEAKEKEREIHRMELCLKSAMREQENIIKEMEQAILKRDVISTRQRGATSSPSHGGRGGMYPSSSSKTSGSINSSNRHSLKLSIKQKSKDIAKSEVELLQIQQDIASKQEEYPKQKQKIEMLESDCEFKGAELKSLQDKLDMLMNEKRGYHVEDDAGVNLTEEQIIEYNDMKALAGIKDIIQKLECEFPDHNVLRQIALMVKGNTRSTSPPTTVTDMEFNR